jgi:hypothetical protein
MSNASDDTLKEAIIAFYRQELEDRYQLSNVRRFEEFSSVADERIDQLRAYFMQRIYPPVEQRAELDFAIDHLGGVLRSPKRMRPLLGVALTTIWKMGSRLPAAVSAGLSTVDAYRESRKLENYLLAYALEQKLRLADTRDRANMVRLIAGVPEADVKRLIYDILALFKALSNVPMLKSAVELMDLFIKTMKANPSYFNQQDLDGVQLGREIVQGGLNLFEQTSPRDLAQVIAGIEKVELDWFERIHQEAAENAA